MSLRRALRRVLPGLAALLLLVVFVGAVALASRSASGDRAWAPDQAVLARVDLSGDSVRIVDVRDFDHAAPGAPVERYADLAFTRDDVRRVWFALAPFASRWRGLAHTFVSFELTDGRFLAVSIEARREAGEAYALAGGLMRAFELTYVIGTERDLLGLRALRGDTLFLFPSRATPAQSADLLVDMLRRAEETRSDPEFYNTLLNNCNTNLRDHVNRATPAHLPWGWGVVLPGFSDRLALEAGVLDTDLPLEEARRRFRVDEGARVALRSRAPASGAASFGRFIRARPATPGG